MLRRLLVFTLALWTTCLALSCSQTMMAAEVPHPWPTDTSPGLTALAKAADQNRYAYVFFWKAAGAATQQQRAAFEAAMATLGDRVDPVSVCITAPEEKPTVDAFKVSRAPMPLVLAIAPNGAITKAWPLDFRAAAAAEGIVSDGMAACMKAFQADKLVLVSVHNSTTAYADEAVQAATGFLNDERFATTAAGVFLDPADPAEASFLAQLKVSPATDKAVTVVLTPPGKPLTTFIGPVSTADIVATVTAAKSGCCPDGKCGPGGKCGPTQAATAKGSSK